MPQKQPNPDPTGPRPAPPPGPSSIHSSARRKALRGAALDATVRSVSLTFSSVAAAADFYKAIGGPTLLAALLQLYRGGAMSNGELTKAVAMLGAPVSVSAVSQALNRARIMGVVSRRIEAQRRVYSLTPVWKEVVAEIAARVEMLHE
jgi:DNA-binding transcriptional ArsR family regulator